MDKLKLISKPETPKPETPKPETPKPETQNKPRISTKFGVNLRMIHLDSVKIRIVPNILLSS